MLFGNLAAIVCTIIVIAALIWMYKIEHPEDKTHSENKNDEEKEEQ